jgi:uncharacterized protein (TIGR04222 family)
VSDFEAVRARLAAYEFDRPDEVTGFTDRLIVETGWPRAFAVRTIEEYRRFAALAATAGHPVSPSKAVDRVWHLHLTETRRYWGEFCGEVLRYELHHDPNRGGEAEDARHRRMYARTLEIYAALFGQEPPADVWPRPAPQGLARLARSLSGRGRRPWLGPRLLFAAAVSALAGCVQIYDSSAPGAIQGPDFIKIYVALGIVAFALMWMFQALFAAAGRRPELPPNTLGPYDLAYLAGGGGRVLATALYRLHQTGRIEIDARGRQATLKAAVPADAPPIERAIADAVAVERLKGTGSIRRSLELLRLRLEGLRLLPGAGGRSAIWGIALLFVGPVLLLGGVRLYFGGMNHRPVGFLVVAMMILVFAAVIRTAHAVTPRGWRRAREVVRQAQGPTALFGDRSGAVMSVALFGVGLESPELRGFVRRQLAQGSDGGGSSCGGGGGCGGGCGG